ncbi:MAG: MBL fold metallo-hydrolase [Nitrososphaerales archaeon]
MGHTFGWPDCLPRPVYASLAKLAPLDPWFEVYRVAPGVYAIYEPFHFEEIISYVIHGDERAILLDTGMGVGDIRAEAENITKLPLVAVNTHWHYDHIAGNYQFEEVWAYDNDFEVRKIEEGVSNAEMGYRMGPDWVCRPIPGGFGSDNYYVRPSRVTHRLRHLEEIDLGGRTLVVHHTPGHSPGGLCLYDRQERLLFSGDVYYPGTLYCNLERSNFPDYLASLEYLAAMLDRVSQVAPSHNEPLVPPSEIAAALDGFRKIADGTAAYTVRNGVRNYRFERFLVEFPDGD